MEEDVLRDGWRANEAICDLLGDLNDDAAQKLVLELDVLDLAGATLGARLVGAAVVDGARAT